MGWMVAHSETGPIYGVRGSFAESLPQGMADRVGKGFSSQVGHLARQLINLRVLDIQRQENPPILLIVLQCCSYNRCPMAPPPGFIPQPAGPGRA